MARKRDWKRELYQQAMQDLLTRKLECALIEGRDAKDADTIADHYGWIVGHLDGELKHCTYYPNGHTAAKELEMRRKVATVPGDKRIDFLSLSEALQDTNFQTVTVLVRTVNQNGEKAWLIYHHPDITLTEAGGFLHCAAEAQRRGSN